MATPTPDPRQPGQQALPHGARRAAVHPQHDQERREEVAQDLQRSRRTPMLMLAIGLIGTLVVLGAAMGPQGAVAYLAWYALSVLLVLALLLAASAAWFGFEIPLHIMVLEVAAVCALADLATALAWLLPLLFLPWVVHLLAFVALTERRLALDIPQAIIFSLLAVFTRFALALLFTHLAGAELVLIL